MSRILEEQMLVNPFAQDSDRPLEKRSQNIEPVISIEEPLMQRAIEAYEFYMINIEMTMRDILDPLTPLQIDTLLQYVLKQDDLQKRYGTSVGDFFSHLIRKSAIELKNKDFTLTTGDCAIKRLPTYLRAGLNINFVGNAGLGVGVECDNCTFDIQGNAYYDLGIDSHDSTIIVRGSVDDYCAASTKHSNVQIYGNCGECLGLGSTEYSVFLVHGDVGDRPLEQAKHCTFKTPNQATYEKACSLVPKGNKVMLLDDKGNLLRQRT